MESKESMARGFSLASWGGAAVVKGLGGAIVAAALACVLLMMGNAPAYAAGDLGKHALPSITKAASLDGESWSESVTAKAGATVFYRLTATMSQTVASDGKALYVFTDKPAKGVEVKTGTVKASLIDKQGNRKASLAAEAQLEGETMSISLGDLKELARSVEYGDEVWVIYEAKVSESASAGRYQNVARLTYDLGDGPRDTVDVRALVEIPEQPQQSADKETLPKTGDAVPGWVYPAAGGLLAVSVALLLMAAARRKGGGRR